MVKSGRGFISCNACQKGIGVLTSIDRNSDNLEQIHSGECVHFKFEIDCLTKSSYIFLNDEINFHFICTCKNCNNERSFNPRCRGVNTDSGIEIKECCKGTKFIFQYEFNSFLEFKQPESDQFTDSKNCLIEHLPYLTKITYSNNSIE